MEHSLFSNNSNSSESSAIASSTTLLHTTASPVGHVIQAGGNSSCSTVNCGEVSSTCSVGSADETVSSPGYINTATESSISSLDDLKNE
uniref:Uncharacterized protein n=1 Tax=Anopheles minimus TaxID=112268 RepID=A0A182WBT3_9DIPT